MISSLLYNTQIKKLYAKFLEKNALYAKVSNNTVILRGRLERVYFSHQRSDDTFTNCLSVAGGVSAIIGGILCNAQCQVASELINEGNNLVQATTQIQKITQETAGSFSTFLQENSKKIGTGIAIVTLGISEVFGIYQKKKEIQKLQQILNLIDKEIQKHVLLFQRFCQAVDRLRSWVVTNQNILEKQNQVLINWKG